MTPKPTSGDASPENRRSKMPYKRHLRRGRGNTTPQTRGFKAGITAGANRLHGQEWGPERYAASRELRLASLRLAAALPHSCPVQTCPQKFGEVLRSLPGTETNMDGKPVPKMTRQPPRFQKRLSIETQGVASVSMRSAKIGRARGESIGAPARTAVQRLTVLGRACG